MDILKTIQNAINKDKKNRLPVILSLTGLVTGIISGIIYYVPVIFTKSSTGTILIVFLFFILNIGASVAGGITGFLDREKSPKPIVLNILMLVMGGFLIYMGNIGGLFLVGAGVFYLIRSNLPQR